jgi:hypothetical protein
MLITSFLWRTGKDSNSKLQIPNSRQIPNKFQTNSKQIPNKLKI